MKDFSTLPLLDLEFIAENFGQVEEDSELLNLHIEMWEGIKNIFADIQTALDLREKEEIDAKSRGISVAMLAQEKDNKNDKNDKTSFNKWHSIRGYSGGVGLKRIWTITGHLECAKDEPIETVRNYVALLPAWAKESIEEAEKVFPYLKKANSQNS